jgi:glycosyltransferase involved in cell wall biosynthesis
MHILLDGRAVHQHMGGIGRAAFDLFRTLGTDRRGHRLSAIVGQNLPREAVIPGVELLQVDAGMIDERFEQLQLPGLLERLKVDLYFNPTFSVPAVKTTRHQLSVIHDVVFEERPAWVEPRLRDYLSRWSRFAAAEADHLLTVSDDARERIRRTYNVQEQRITRIYNGIADEWHVPPAPIDVEWVLRKYKIARPFVLYLGSIEPKKGVAELVAAFSHVAESGKSVSLVLAGGRGSQVLDIEGLLRRSPLRSKVRWLGFVDEADKKALVKACDLFCYPSLYEGFGLPPLEAMAHGVPCIVSGETSLPEIAGDASLVAPVQDPEGFASVLLRGLEDAEFRAQAADRGPRRAREFTWQRSAGQFLDLCESLEAA